MKPEPDMLDEYDFSRGVRGSYVERSAIGTNSVILAPEVALDPRFDFEGDDIVRQLIPADALARSPEEYAARHAHEWGCLSFHLFRYRDPTLGTWVRRLGEIIFSDSEIERSRAQFLTAEEIAEVKRREVEGF